MCCTVKRLMNLQIWAKALILHVYTTGTLNLQKVSTWLEEHLLWATLNALNQRFLLLEA